MLADAIVEVTETGSSLRANRLRVLDTVMESNTKFIANRIADSCMLMLLRSDYFTRGCGGFVRNQSR